VFVVVSRDILARSNFSTVVCAPVLSRGEGLSTQVPVGPGEGLKHESWIFRDALASIEKARLTDFVGALHPDKTRALNRALASALGLG
jgi:mRNA interferase MazF